jgi:hypothetical protein
LNFSRYIFFFPTCRSAIGGIHFAGIGYFSLRPE